MSDAPHDAYLRRSETHARAAERHGLRDRQLSAARLAVFAAGVVLAFAAWGWHLISAAWVALPAAGFGLLLLLHDRVIRAREEAERGVAFYERGLARLEQRFAGMGESGDRFRDPAHPYAEDLDLFGAGSLFELLCSVRTRAGEERLASWLLTPAPPETIRERQQAVAELAPALDLREDLALLGENLSAALHPDSLRRWGEAPGERSSRALPLLGILLSGVSLAGLAAWIFSGAGPLPFVAALLLQGGFGALLRRRVLPIVSAVEAPARDLALLSDLLARLERERFEAPRLVALRRVLDTEGVPASLRIAQLRRRVELLDARRNQLFAPIGALLLWTTQLALAIERWRGRCGPVLGAWIDAVAELEALSCLASHAYENPGHVFAEIDAGPEPRFAARSLGHVLIPTDRCVANDVELDGACRVLVVSGSNMSGKSTLLRSVGSNAVLAQAGAPVCAAALRMTPLAVGASIRVQDSLQAGSSRFYAEIQRLHQIMEIAGKRPTLFLLDEILHGTNSHDRGIGAEAVVRGLLDRNAIGLVTTHDLALARVAETLAPAARNVHFEDHLEDGRMVFDYRMQPGVVTHSNALELMRSIGLDV